MQETCARNREKQGEAGPGGQQGGLRKRLESQGSGCACRVVSQGWSAWINYLAMLESIKPLGCRFLSFIKLLCGIMVPSKISAMTPYGTSSPSLLFWFLIGGKSTPSYLGCCSYAVAHLWYLFREIKQPKYEPLGVTMELQGWLILEVPGDDILKQGMQ